MKRYKKWVAAGVALTIVGISAGCGQSTGGNDGGTKSVSNSESNQTTNVTNTTKITNNAVGSTPSFFTPPKNMTQTFEMLSNDGQLRVVAYADPKDPNIYVRQLYVVTNNSVSTPLVLYHYDNSKDWVHGDQLFWFGQGSEQYLALLKGVSITPEEAGGKVKLEQFSCSNTGSWHVTSQTSVVVPGGQLYKLDASHLLFESSGLGIQTPVEYTFSKNGVQHQFVTEEYPKHGEVSNSVTRIIYVTGTPASGGTINYKIAGDFTTLHMKVGQKLVIRVVFNVKPKLPLAVLMYPDVGDPGPGSLANYDASPYVDAKVCTLVNTAKHGQVVIFPEILQGVKAGPKTPTGIIKIPIVVQK